MTPFPIAECVPAGPFAGAVFVAGRRSRAAARRRGADLFGRWHAGRVETRQLLDRIADEDRRRADAMPAITDRLIAGGVAVEDGVKRFGCGVRGSLRGAANRGSVGGGRGVEIPKHPPGGEFLTAGWWGLSSKKSPIP